MAPVSNLEDALPALIAVGEAQSKDGKELLLPTTIEYFENSEYQRFKPRLSRSLVCR
jgi:hypothetical protein